MPSGVYKRTEETKRKLSEVMKIKAKKFKNGGWKKCIICGRKFYRPKGELSKAKFCSIKCRIIGSSRIQKGRKRPDLAGKNNYNWKGGITPERTRIYFSKEYKDWRKAVFERDNYTCQKCGDNSGNNLRSHHLDSFADYPEKRFDVDNGITLCKNCHIYFHSKYGTHHNTKEQLKEFLNEKQKTIITSRGRQVMAGSSH